MVRGKGEGERGRGENKGEGGGNRKVAGNLKMLLFRMRVLVSLKWVMG